MKIRYIDVISAVSKLEVESSVCTHDWSVLRVIPVLLSDHVGVGHVGDNV